MRVTAQDVSRQGQIIVKTELDSVRSVDIEPAFVYLAKKTELANIHTRLFKIINYLMFHKLLIVALSVVFH